MAKFSDASMIQRRQMIEEALAEALGHILDISKDQVSGERFIFIATSSEECDQFSLWDIASEIEVKLA